MNILFKKLMAGIAVLGFAVTSLPSLAAEMEPPAPATEHQEETLKRDKGTYDAEGSTRKGATGSEEGKKGRTPPATEHQEKTLKGEQKSDDSSKKMMEEPSAPQ